MITKTGSLYPILKDFDLSLVNCEEVISSLRRCCKEGLKNEAISICSSQETLNKNVVTITKKD